MFHETLLESSPTSARRRRWPMATAFAFQVLIAIALVAVPLLSAGVIPLTSPLMPVPISYEKPVAEKPNKPATGPAAAGPAVPTREIATMTGRSSSLSWRTRPTGDSPVGDAPVPCFEARCIAGASATPSLFIGGQLVKPPRPSGPVRMSRIDPGMLINRVVPEYPPMAGRTGVQGEVKLHAIIGRDGSIQSLTVISGHPFLIQAAMEAVQQWKYRPYVLNGETVEVDTFITVNFKRSN
jgi:periplasmic protein TonB